MLSLPVKRFSNRFSETNHSTKILIGDGIMSEVEARKVMSTVAKNREKILILEKIVEELVNTGYVDQNDYRKFHKEAVDEVKKDFNLN